ncbi:hypothetical protein SHELI_v1c04260 [Spiroplasma helicoides]|uniref:Uncharacterized protein n=2 Tax=Spiroplasma helicoides TaxID=216938 RepID=A0A1B3SKC8_9MOLU|nr:hypothetical protein SHELI_v1c04260 [Spiroplasma helicoides]
MKEYFKDLFIGAYNEKLVYKFINVEIHRSKNKIKNSAWDFFVLLTTSVLANKSEGLISEAVDSIYKVFQSSKKLLLDMDGYNLVSDVILKILNTKIRPILTWTRSFPKVSPTDSNKINDNQISVNDKNEFWNKMKDFRKELIEKKIP